MKAVNIKWDVTDGAEEMTQEEAAQYLGISQEVLRAKLYRARKFIRKKFRDKY